ncbi:hypothetical protein Oscil6304_5897 [Oscillatoria acuminata PCC 6304]|uniref:Uncharacterized protein n=1 Tax=Oscillatoria acuminata PCC 6304 TaxID=56110 RepID=K9TT73_9CYAN|nr:hypothetical protein Oscil6304_5897 [Oscillatoria acuminata PCC 6304]
MEAFMRWLIQKFISRLNPDSEQTLKTFLVRELIEFVFAKGQFQPGVVKAILGLEDGSHY